MKMIAAEFRGKRRGFFREKPVFKVGSSCPRCGSGRHIGTTTCEVRLWTRSDYDKEKGLRL